MKTKNLVILGAVLVAGYFIWKKMGNSNTISTDVKPLDAQSEEAIKPSEPAE
jgi:outer membrane murein-binding lipoprotein Lpp